MKTLFIYIKTALQLGLTNCFLSICHRIFTNKYIGPIIFHKRISISLDEDIFLASTLEKYPIQNENKVLLLADSIIKGQYQYFSFHKKNIGTPPNWFMDPFNESIIDKNLHWTKLNDFDSNIVDIKNIWELSRFNWLGTLAMSYSATSNMIYIDTMNSLVKDWVANNRFNFGPNWKCGQEASIRVINLIISHEITGGNEIRKYFEQIILMHLKRISQTQFYSKAQDNNHAISEGIALYVGGSLLFKKTCDKIYKNYITAGFNIIEERIDKLIMDDGTFSQYSIVYHRMILDLLSILELFRQKYQGIKFSKRFYEKVKLAITWYEKMIDPVSGGASNIGGNDGTYLFNYNHKEYRDFRPTLNLISSLFNIPISKELLSTHCISEVFNIPSPSIKDSKKRSENFSYGGYLNLSKPNGNAILRVPNYKFRPSQCDALHLDIWEDGVNWVRGTGSYSYGADVDVQEYFSGTKGHSTVIFDNQNQMPRISRFLFGNWLRPSYLTFDELKNIASAGYIDNYKNMHNRSVKSTKNGWEVIDEMNGNFDFGTLRYILKPDEWEINNNQIQNKFISISINSDSGFTFNLSSGYDSLYYMKKVKTSVLEIGFNTSCTINTKIIFKS